MAQSTRKKRSNSIMAGIHCEGRIASCETTWEFFANSETLRWQYVSARVGLLGTLRLALAGGYGSKWLELELAMGYGRPALTGWQSWPIFATMAQSMWKKRSNSIMAGIHCEGRIASCKTTWEFFSSSEAPRWQICLSPSGIAGHIALSFGWRLRKQVA